MKPIPALLAVLMLLTAASARAEDLSTPGPYPAGWRTVTVTRPDQTTFSARVHYPALAAGQNAARDTALPPLPAVTFGHGFLTPVSAYQSTLQHLATHGYIVIASESEGSLFPSHSRFAGDLSHCLTYLIQQSDAPGSWLEGAIDPLRLGASGHSMGGGASILAAAADPRIRALAPLAPAETNPSAATAAANLSIPFTAIVGTQDTITPTASHGQLMYNAAPGPRRMISQIGGFHCGYIDSSTFGCDSGAMPRAEQLALTRALLTAFFDLHLKGDHFRAPLVWDPQTPTDPRLAAVIDPRLALSAPPAPLSARGNAPIDIPFIATVSGPLPRTLTPGSESPWLLAAPGPTGPISPGDSAPLSIIARVPAGTPFPATTFFKAWVRTEANVYAYAVATLTAACPADFNEDGGVDGSDVEAFFVEWEMGDARADVNDDGGVDGSDVEVFFLLWEAGGC
jgi:predicted dienelactone hydrolase